MRSVRFHRWILGTVGTACLCLVIVPGPSTRADEATGPSARQRHLLGLRGLSEGVRARLWEYRALGVQVRWRFGRGLLGEIGWDEDQLVKRFGPQQRKLVEELRALERLRTRYRSARALGVPYPLPEDEGRAWDRRIGEIYDALAEVGGLTTTRQRRLRAQAAIAGLERLIQAALSHATHHHDKRLELRRLAELSPAPLARLTWEGRRLRLVREPIIWLR